MTRIFQWSTYLLVSHQRNKYWEQSSLPEKQNTRCLYWASSERRSHKENNFSDMDFCGTSLPGCLGQWGTFWVQCLKDSKKLLPGKPGPCQHTHCEAQNWLNWLQNHLSFLLSCEIFRTTDPIKESVWLWHNFFKLSRTLIFLSVVKDNVYTKSSPLSLSCAPFLF